MIVRFDPEPEALRCLRVGPLRPHLQSFATLLCQNGYLCIANSSAMLFAIGVPVAKTSPPPLFTD